MFFFRRMCVTACLHTFYCLFVCNTRLHIFSSHLYVTACPYHLCCIFIHDRLWIRFLLLVYTWQPVHAFFRRTTFVTTCLYNLPRISICDCMSTPFLSLFNNTLIPSVFIPLIFLKQLDTARVQGDEF